MAALRTVLVLLSIGARAHSTTAPTATAPPGDPRQVVGSLNLAPVSTGGFELLIIEGDERQVLGHIGRTVSAPYYTERVENGVRMIFRTTNVTITTQYDDKTPARVIRISWLAEPSTRLEDCIDFGTKHWYAGPMQESQYYPVENSPNHYSASYINEWDLGSIMERYWLNSAGEYIYVHSEAPLYVDYKNIKDNHLCFGAELTEPYSSRRTRTVLAYDMWFLSDVKKAHKHAVDNYLGKPSDTPDYRMIQHPVWATWDQFGADVHHTGLLYLAQQIISHGFQNSLLQIDALWESCYGSLTVDRNKFPDFGQTIKDLKELGYRVSIWVHPFIHVNCEPWYSEALRSNYFVRNESGNPNTSWWFIDHYGPEGDLGYVDFTNPAAAEWWHRRVLAVLETYDVDTVRCDTSETDLAPEIADLTGDIELQPHLLTMEYAKICARFGNMVNIRSAFRNQDMPIYMRMRDRYTIWDSRGGLPSVLTTALQMNLNGYPYILPDVIMGSGHPFPPAITWEEPNYLDTYQELFIRWLQATTFLPVIQFSYAPWNFDNETLTISKKFVELHASYADMIFEGMEAAVSEGTPLNAPLWWADPNDKEALVIWDEFLLAERVLVAPVLTQGARSRDVYLPAGTWYEQGDRSRIVEGPTWLRSYPAPLDTLPYFVRDAPSSAHALTSLFSSVVLVLLSLMLHRLY